MAEVKTKEEIAEDLANVGNFVNQLGSVVLGIATAATTGVVVGTSVASNVGLAVVFFQQMFQGITAAEMAKKFNDLKIEWQQDKLEDMFAYNQLQEELIKEKIRNEAENYERESIDNIETAQWLHLTLAIVLIMIVIVAMWFFFKRKSTN